MNSAAAASLVIAKPAGTATGDVLVASLALNGATIASAPTGWVPIAAIASLSNPKLYSYYRVAGSAEPASYSWGLSGAAAGSIGIARYTGVSSVSPLAASTTTAISTAAVSSLTAPAVTTAAPGAMLIGAAAVNSSNASLLITGPAGMAQRWDLGGKRQEFDDAIQAAAGSSGGKTWTFSGAREGAVWLTALRPR